MALLASNYGENATMDVYLLFEDPVWIQIVTMVIIHLSFGGVQGKNVKGNFHFLFWQTGYFSKKLRSVYSTGTNLSGGMPKGEIKIFQDQRLNMLKTRTNHSLEVLKWSYQKESLNIKFFPPIQNWDSKSKRRPIFTTSQSLGRPKIHSLFSK